MEQKYQHVNIISPILTGVSGLAPMRDGEILPGDAVRIVDRHSSFYPIPTGNKDEFILIDSGMDRQARKLKRFLIERNLAISAFVAGFLTHAHSDHVAGFNYLKGMPVYVGEHDRDVVVGIKHSQGFMPASVDLIPKYLGGKIPDLEPLIISDDQVIEIGSLTIRGIAMNGHTDGSMGYLIGHRDKNEYVFYVGDSFDHSRRGKLRLPPRIVSANRNASSRSIINATRRIIESKHESSIPIELRAVVPSHSGHRDFSSMRRYSNL
jgi:glyoxylase-like metal-dependent hydrolase (beta-lactamase superfamily II)